jgi:hypothetical protein
MKKIIAKQLAVLNAYLNDAFKSNAHIGFLFYVVVIGLGVAIYSTMEVRKPVMPTQNGKHTTTSVQKSK